MDEELSLPGELEIEESGISLRLELLAVSCMAALRPRLGGLRAAFDAQLAGPCLRLRRPQQGDRFQPLGMTGCKKLSDFLVDLKWPRLLRQELLLLTRPDGEIVWVIGLRLAHPFRVLSATRQIGLVEVTCLQDEP